MIIRADTICRLIDYGYVVTVKQETRFVNLLDFFQKGEDLILVWYIKKHPSDTHYVSSTLHPKLLLCSIAKKWS